MVVEHCGHASFNPRPPGGGRLTGFKDVTALLAMFQSTPPRRRATGGRLRSHDGICVSIHAPPEEGDLSYESLLHDVGSFNPRPPGGGRRNPAHAALAGHILRFNPRPPEEGDRKMLFVIDLDTLDMV